MTTTKLRRFSAITITCLALGSCTPSIQGPAPQTATPNEPEASIGLQPGSYVGETEDATTFVAIVIYKNEALAYVCDGDQAVQWFSGTLSADGQLQLRSAETWTLAAKLDGTVVTGHYTNAEGRAVRFTAPPANGEAGLYRTEFERDGVVYIGGWVVREDGEQRGAVIGGGTGRRTRNLETVTYRANIKGFGTFPTERVTPAYVDAAVKP